MIERDYIMRLIQQLSGVLAKIVFAKKAQNYEEAQQIVQHAYEELFGMQGEMIHELDAETLAQLLGQAEKIFALAALLHEEGDLLVKNHPDDGQERYSKSLTLYEKALERKPELQDECSKAIATLQKKLRSES